MKVEEDKKISSDLGVEEFKESLEGENDISCFEENLKEENNKEENKIKDENTNKEEIKEQHEEIKEETENIESKGIETSKISNDVTIKNEGTNLSNYIKEEDVQKYTKFGVVFREITTNYYKNNEKVKSTTKTNCDKTNYQASLEELKEEVLKVKAEYQVKQEEIYNYVNELRNKAQVNPLKLDKDLEEAAMIRAMEMAYSGIVKHVRPDGSSWASLTNKAKGENIAYGAKSTIEVMKDWQNSKGHYQNIINASYKTIGIGVFNLNGEFYWVQQFGY